MVWAKRRCLSNRFRRLALVSLGFAAIATAGCASGPPPAPPISPEQRETITGIQVLCLQIEQSYPEIAGGNVEPLRGRAEQVLESMGFRLGYPCDATLEFNVEGKALGAEYWNRGYAYAGAVYEGHMALTLPTGDELLFHIRGIDPVDPMERVEDLRSTAKAAPFENAWAAALLDGLVQVWGVQSLAAACVSQYIDVRSLARDRLEDAGREAVPALIQALEDEAGSLRAAAAAALGVIGRPAAQEAVPALTKALEDEERLVRVWAIGALGAIGPGAQAVPALLRLLEDGELGAARALEAIGPEASEAVPYLIRALAEDRHQRTRAAAAKALGAIGPAAQEAVPALRKALEDRSPSVRQAAAEALAAITG